MGNYICGIQQVGIGTTDMHRDWKWYRRAFGMDIRIFEDAAEAPLMTKYTGGNVHKRLAALAMNMQGGGGFEIWQYTSRKAERAKFEIALGDCGFLAVKLKTQSVEQAYQALKKQGVSVLTAPAENPAGVKHFYASDPNGYWFEIVESPDYFREDKAPTGGVYGMVIGVSDMDAAMQFYGAVLGFDHVLSDSNAVQGDLSGLPGCNHSYRRVILGQTANAVAL